MAEFFNMVKNEFNKGVATVGTSSAVFVEKSKINTQIKALEDEKKQLCELLGARVCHLYETGAGDISRRDVEGFVTQISARNQAILAEQQKLVELERVASQPVGTPQVITNACPCGFVNAPGAKFCAGCGRPVTG